MHTQYHQAQEEEVRDIRLALGVQRRVCLLAPGQTSGTVSGNQELLPGFVLPLPDSGCTSNLPSLCVRVII